MNRSRLSSFLTRYFLLVAAAVLVTELAIMGLSEYLSALSRTQTSREELQSAVSQADRLLEKYSKGQITRAALAQAVNPTLNTTDTFWMLLDASGAVVAYTERAVPYFSGDRLENYKAMLDSADTLFIQESELGSLLVMLGVKTENGYIFAARPTTLFNEASYSFRSNLLMVAMPLFLLMILLFTMAGRRVSKPVTVLTNAADRISGGEKVEMDEDMPGELGQVARALNTMSGAVSQSMRQVRAERETLRQVLEGVSEGILALDEKDEIIHENKAALELLGGRQDPAYEKVLHALGKFEGKETEILRIDRGEQKLECLLSPLPGDEGGHIALIRDITSQELLEQTRFDYVANISHELRTPLANMRGLAEGLRDGLVTDERDRERYYGIIVDEVKRLSRLVNDLLELSGLQSNPAAFEMDQTEPTELLWELFDLNKKLFSEKKQALLLDLPGEDLPAIITNEDRLSEVLTIFLDNARKYTPEGGEIILGAHETEKGVRFFVKDNGIGMDEDTRRLAFDRFHQADRSHSAKGSGLGLSIAREILRKMGVEIALVSAPGKGSEFSFILPIQQDKE